MTRIIKKFLNVLLFDYCMQKIIVIGFLLMLFLGCFLMPNSYIEFLSADWWLSGLRNLGITLGVILGIILLILGLVKLSKWSHK